MAVKGFDWVEKKDLCYLLVILGVIFVAAITFWVGGKGNDMVSYLGFAGTVTSIILAIVAIFYAIVQGVTSQQNIGQMQGIMNKVDEATGKLHERASDLEMMQCNLKEVVAKTGDMFNQAKPATAPEGSKSGKGGYRLEWASNTGLLSLYWACRTLKSLKASSPKIFCEVLGQYDPAYVFGFLVGFNCYDWEGDFAVGINKLKATNLPKNFEKEVGGMLENAVSLYRNEGKEDTGDRLETARKKIDAYFAE